jgi:hypothetical protein
LKVTINGIGNEPIESAEQAKAATIKVVAFFKPFKGLIIVNYTEITGTMALKKPEFIIPIGALFKRIFQNETGDAAK